MAGKEDLEDGSRVDLEASREEASEAKEEDLDHLEVTNKFHSFYVIYFIRI